MVAGGEKGLEGLGKMGEGRLRGTNIKILKLLGKIQEIYHNLIVIAGRVKMIFSFLIFKRIYVQK